jgi:LPS export ABC transporter protein LptC
MGVIKLFKSNVIGLACASVVICLLLAACNGKVVSQAELKVYAGPTATATHVTTNYSDSGRTKVLMTAPLQLEYQDGDREFPKGIQLDFFDKYGNNSSRLTSRYARYEKTYDIYIAQDNVVVKDLIEAKTLNTEELRWSRPKQKVYTDKFVRVTTARELLTGLGLEAAQDFSWYRILKPTAETQDQTLE